MEPERLLLQRVAQRLVGRLVKGAVACVSAVLVLATGGCSKPAPARVVVDAAASSPVAAASPERRDLVNGACLSCHGEELLAQQRLPRDKWAGVVKKMVGWGANLDPADTEPLIDYLARAYGPDAGPWEAEVLPAQTATARLEAEDAGAYAGGEVEPGKKLFLERCASCHGANARGSIGVNLVERPLLFRAADVATTVRAGRGKMAPLPATSDREIADILVYLRSLRGSST